MIAEVQAEFKIFGTMVQKLELLGRTDGGLPANRVAGCLQIGQKNARGAPSPRIWRVCSFRRRRSLPGSIVARCCHPLFCRARSPHPQTDAAALRCAALSTGAFTPSADGCRDFALRSVFPQGAFAPSAMDAAALRCTPPQGKHFLGRCSARRGDADDVVHKIERLQRALDRGGAAHDVGEHDGAVPQLDGADIFHDRFLLIAGNADNR